MTQILQKKIDDLEKRMVLLNIKFNENVNKIEEKSKKLLNKYLFFVLRNIIR